MHDLPVPITAEPSIKISLPGPRNQLAEPVPQPQPVARKKLGVPGAMAMGFGPLGPTIGEA